MSDKINRTNNRMDQPKIERLLRLMKLLTANTEYTVDDLAERLGMSRRTVYRYIDTFRDAGFVVRKSGACIRLDKESPHFREISQLVHFTEEEAVILRRAIESIDDTNLLKQNLKRKLCTVYDNKTLAQTVVRGRQAPNIHALIDIDAECAKSAVIELSKMMRYVLYDSGREHISLEKDVQFLENYIELMRIRYVDAIDIRVRYPRPLPAGVTIPPLLLIVFVENAFKHGVSYNRSSFIHIDIACDGGMLVSRIVNSRHREPDAGRTGIGLENVRKRLDLIYGPKGYGLRIDDSDPATYTVQLEIPTFNA